VKEKERARVTSGAGEGFMAGREAQNNKENKK